MIYSTFWRRVGAQLLDVLFILPVLALNIALSSLGRGVYVGMTALLWLFNLGYSVYLVKRFGGTPGKLVLGLRIVQMDGLPISYKQALLRYIVYLFLSTCSAVALIMAALAITDTHYASLNWRHRNVTLIAMAPSWYPWANGLLQLWALGLVIVMLTNSERRATHDFIAGTVVVRKAQSPDAAEVAPEPPSLPAG